MCYITMSAMDHRSTKQRKKIERRKDEDSTMIPKDYKYPSLQIAAKKAAPDILHFTQIEQILIVYK